VGPASGSRLPPQSAGLPSDSLDLTNIPPDVPWIFPAMACKRFPNLGIFHGYWKILTAITVINSTISMDSTRYIPEIICDFWKKT
jgi:hypothetical protein